LGIGSWELTEGMSVITTATETDLIARARTVASVADKHADEGDRKGDLSQPVVEALLRERILGMWTPKALGGSELDVVSSLRVLEHLAYGDPSAGWVAMAASLAIGTGAAYLKDAAVDELFGGGRFPVIAGQGTKPGTSAPLYVGLLPDCPKKGAAAPPCIASRSFSKPTSSVSITVTASGDDPWRY